VARVARASDLPLPQNLADSIAADQDPRRRAWLDRLPGIVRCVARNWGLDLGAPFQPGGQCSWVAPARTADGARLVLKVEWLHPEAEREAAALRFWDGTGLSGSMPTRSSRTPLRSCSSDASPAHYSAG
jgi:streptomycin 6-kinase